jgi:Lrp/AsnC family transcriptional regulator for asnA, asnC and gidA
VAIVLDDLDLAIIAGLQDNARRPFSHIAEELGVSEGTVRLRVGRMQRLDILQFALEVDPHVLDLVYTYVGIWVRGPMMKRTIDTLCAIPEVSFLVTCASGFDLLAEVICRDQKALLRVLHDEIRETPGVERAEAYTVLKTNKSSLRYLGLETGIYTGRKGKPAAEPA